MTVAEPHRGAAALSRVVDGLCRSFLAAVVLVAATVASSPAADATGSGANEQAPAAPVPESAPPAAEGGPPASGGIAFTPFDDKVFTEAERSGAPFVLFFTAEWCQPCREMHERTFRAPAVVEAAAGTRFLRVDLTKPDRYVRLVKKSFRVLGAPTVIVFGPDGKEKTRRFGFIPPEDFARMLGEGARREGST